eukprot:scaffold7727_cov258-Pinguiococcus_pyrenoidosus.AAC.1
MREYSFAWGVALGYLLLRSDAGLLGPSRDSARRSLTCPGCVLSVGFRRDLVWCRKCSCRQTLRT